MKGTFSVGDIKARPGSIESGYLTRVEERDGTFVGVPTIVVNGAEDGPVLSMIAGTHPNEQGPIDAVRHLVKGALDPKKIKGAVVVVACANPLGFQHGQYISPNDGVNIYLTYPGDKNGSITRRIAATIWEEVGLKSDCVIDFHSNYKPCLMFSYMSNIEDKATLKRTYSLAKAAGLTIIFSDEKLYPASRGVQGITDLLMREGIPGFTFEVQASNDIDPDSVRVAVRGVQNVMKALKMLPGEPEPHPEIKVLDGGYCFYGMVKANRAGLVEKIARPGEKLTKGTVVARIHNLFGDEVEAIKAPVDGYLWSYPLRTWIALQTQAVETGGDVCYFFVDYKRPFS